VKPVIALEFTITAAAINARITAAGGVGVPDDPGFALRCRVILTSSGVEVYTADISRLGEHIWVEIDNGGRVWAPGPAPINVRYMLNRNDVASHGLARLAELAMERVPHRVAGDADVLDLGVL
jgi:hypothetical protein